MLRYIRQSFTWLIAIVAIILGLKQTFSHVGTSDPCYALVAGQQPPTAAWS